MQALAAGVDDSGFGEHVQQVGRVGHGLAGGIHDLRDEILHRLDLGLRGLGGFTSVAGHGEDGALDGIGDGLVANLVGALECGAELGDAELAMAVESLGKAANDLGQDDTGVSASAKQGAARQVGGHGVHVI